jgi:hypothetical protein
MAASAHADTCSDLLQLKIPGVTIVKAASITALSEFL